MSGALPLLARLGDAASFPRAVSHYETDAWNYMRRKLAECEAPLRAYKRALYEEASARLHDDLRDPDLKPEQVLAHKETFEKLMTPGDFADLLFHLDGSGPAARRAEIKSVLASAKVKTVFDTEVLPPERRGKPWQALVEETSRRLDLDRLKAILDRGPATDRRRAYVLRRARRNLAEFMTVTRGHAGMRDEITLFVLTRLEAVIAAVLRLLNSQPPAASNRA